MCSYSKAKPMKAKSIQLMNKFCYKQNHCEYCSVQTHNSAGAGVFSDLSQIEKTKILIQHRLLFSISFRFDAFRWTPVI